MSALLASTETVTTAATTTTDGGGFFPPYFAVMILALVIIFLVACVLKIVSWRVIDWITPGDLGKELLGNRPDGKPNVALAIVVAGMFLGLSITLGCTVIGVLNH
jgi:uncharacterized membrane protein YjfL (UPF0719 family)